MYIGIHALPFFVGIVTGPVKLLRERGWGAEAGRRRGVVPGSSRRVPTAVWYDKEQSRGA